MKIHDFVENNINRSDVDETEGCFLAEEGSGVLRRWIERHYNSKVSCRTTSRIKNDSDANAFIKRRAVWYRNIHCRGNKQIVKEEGDLVELPDNVLQFINCLRPDARGMDHIDDHKVHYHGFSDAFKANTQKRCALHPDHPKHLADYDHIYDDVLNNIIKRENGMQPLSAGLAGSDENPIMYAVYHHGVEETAIDRQINEGLSRIPLLKKFIKNKHAI